MDAVARREDILRKSGELFAHRGVAGTTVREIADAVGLLSGSLYHYFPSKDSIASELISSFLSDLLDEYGALTQLDTAPRHVLYRLIYTSLKVAADHEYATEVYQNELSKISSLPRHEVITDYVRQAHQIWQAIVEFGIEAGDFRRDLDATMIHRVIRETVWLEVRRNRRTLRADYPQLARDLVTLFFDGLGSAPVEPWPAMRTGDVWSVEEVDTLRSQIEQLQSRLSEVRSALDGVTARFER